MQATHCPTPGVAGADGAGWGSPKTGQSRRVASRLHSPGTSGHTGAAQWSWDKSTLLAAGPESSSGSPAWRVPKTVACMGRSVDTGHHDRPAPGLPRGGRC